MSVKVQALIWEHAPYRGNTLLTFLALGDWSNDEGVCWPKIATLAKKSRQSVRNARYAVELLCRDGFLVVDVNPGRGHQNDFRLNLQKLQHLASQKVQFTTPKGAIGDTKRCKTQQRNKEEPSLTVSDPSVSQNQHAFAELIESEVYKNAQAVRDWMTIKKRIKELIHEKEWQQWVRPLYLFNVLMGRYLLLAIPVDGRIQLAAEAGKTLLRSVVMGFGYGGASYVPYPDDYTLCRLQREATPEFWQGIPPALRKRVRYEASMEGSVRANSLAGSKENQGLEARLK
jgi:hypothetical protein